MLAGARKGKGGGSIDNNNRRGGEEPGAGKGEGTRGGRWCRCVGSRPAGLLPPLPPPLVACCARRPPP